MQRVYRAWLRCARLVGVAAFVLSAPAAWAAEPITAQSFEGVWKVTRVVNPDGSVNSQLQPGLTIFARGYFAILRDTSNGPRARAPDPKDRTKPTDAEKLALY